MQTDDIKWIGHASFILEDKEGRQLCFLDPFEIGSVQDRADIIFITHGHYDHASPDDVKRLLTPNTMVVAAPNCIEKFPVPNKQTMIVEPNIDFEVKGIKAKTIPAYNIKPERLNFHPRKNEWVGYIININNKKIYHAGDTDFVDEMTELGKLDVAMLPMGGTYTMDVDEAIRAANAIRAKVTVPMHYKRLLGDRAKEAERKFKDGVQGEVVFMKEIA